MAEVDAGEGGALPTGVDELDRVLGGGLVAGSVILLGGEPGIGKSTLSLQMLASVAVSGGRALLVSGEESPSQLRRRADRLGAVVPGMWLASANSLGDVLHFLEQVEPDVAVVDSIQTLADPDQPGPPGTVGQVRACAQRLADAARASGAAVVLVGHVTKEGGLAGPRSLEHLVDTVALFEGDRHDSLRMLRAVKHRFGPTGELGLFEMGEEGLRCVADGSVLLLGERRAGLPGSVVVPALEGRRVLALELQALVAPPGSGGSNRFAQGVDGRRLALVLAVLERRVGLALGGAEVFASAVGGVRVGEPAADLGLALAVASAATGVALPADLVVLGEVGLGGEVRQVPGTPRRLSEASRLGFRRAVVPCGFSGGAAGLEVVAVATLKEAVGAFGPEPRPGAG